MHAICQNAAQAMDRIVVRIGLRASREVAAACRHRRSGAE
jgi:hypothetical protein